MVNKDQELVRHGTNLPSFLQRGGKSGNTADKTFNFGVLDWNRLEKWKSNTKCIMKTNNLANGDSARLSTSVNNIIPQSDQQASNGSLFNSSLRKRFSFGLEKLTKTFSPNFKTSSPYQFIKSGLITYKSSCDLHKFNSQKANGNLICSGIDPSYEKTLIHEKKQKSSNVQALLKLTMKNGIPFFKLMVDNSSNILTAAVKKLPSGKDDSSLIYTFHFMHEIKKKIKDSKNQASKEKDSRFGYKIVGNMNISSSYHAEFNGLERDLFVVRESVLYGPESELAAIIVKNTSKENHGGLGSSKSTVVILPGGSHSLPNSGQPSTLINRWRSGGICDCGGWDVGCQLGVLTNQNEMIEILDPSTSDCLDLCYQGRHNNKHAFSLAPLENGFYTLEYDASISLLQAFSICVAVISSQNLTHIFQVNHLQDANDFIKPIMRRRQKVKSQTILHAKIPPFSPIGRV